LTTSHARLRVVGASCASCFAAVRKTLFKHEGVIDVRANIAADLLLLDYDPDKVRLEELLEVIRKAGYRAVPMR